MNSVDKCIRYVRGQVWRVDDGIDKYSSRNHIQHGSRPAIIVSSNAGNQTSPNVTIVPLTSKVDKRLSVNVPIHSDGTADSLALCSQMTVVPKTYLKYYMYTLSDSDMKTVEHSILESLGMDDYKHKSYASCSFDQLKSVIESIVQNRVNEILSKSNHSNVDVEYIENMVDNLVETQGSIEGAEPSTDSNVNSDRSQSMESIRNPYKKRIRWTDSNVRQFLSDYNKYDRQKLATMWGLSERGIYTTLKRCRERQESLKV